jgi:uncharacterized protein (DUF427 family)
VNPEPLWSLLDLEEGKTRFPKHAVRQEFLHPSDTHAVCPWKGTASYYDVVVDE